MPEEYSIPIRPPKIVSGWRILYLGTVQYRESWQVQTRCMHITYRMRILRYVCNNQLGQSQSRNVNAETGYSLFANAESELQTKRSVQSAMPKGSVNGSHESLEKCGQSMRRAIVSCRQRCRHGQSSSIPGFRQLDGEG